MCSQIQDRVRRLWPGPIIGLLVLLFPGDSGALASSLRISAGSTSRLPNEIEADYTTTHAFVDEVAGQSVPITLFFDPQTLDVASAEAFSNLNRRDRATQDANGDGVEDGIKPPPGNSIAAGDDHNYYKAYPMQLISGGYQLTLFATKCGAYRLSARYRLNSDPPGTYHWYGDEMNGQGIPKRDHAIVVSPAKARNLQLYETPLLAILATGTLPEQRGTFAALTAGPSPAEAPRFGFAYLKQLGCNTIWLLPIHPIGIDGRETDPSTGQPYDVGSPYSVKNFFAVNPLLSQAFKPGGTPAANDTPAGRQQALAEFQKFVSAADSQGIDVMLDAPFNHSAHDAELAPSGQTYWGNASSSATSEVRAVEARVYSHANFYDQRGMNAATIGLAPDRFDFGKWPDTFDFYFGRYSALVPDSTHPGDYLNEGDWFDYSVGSEDGRGEGNAHFDTITQNLWRYFGDYLQTWLTLSGYPTNATGASLDSSAGIDGLRGDFGQGLPPQCWEYLVNRTRTRKWNFVFLAESLDGGHVTYRSARHFDVLNDNLIYDLRGAQTAGQFRNVYESRIRSYGRALILLNTTSHDEDNFNDPFEGFMRFCINNAMGGVSMISAGQELGTRGRVVPPSGDSSPNAPAPFGYDRYFAPFLPDPVKLVPQFMIYNSIMPLWKNLQARVSPTPQLLNLYRAVGQARSASPALRSDNHIYLNLMNGQAFDEVFSVAKFEHRNGSATTNDIVFAFVNLTAHSAQGNSPGHWFNLKQDQDNNGVNDFGIQPARLYNVKNLAAYTGADTTRAGNWLWPSPRAGSDLLQNGISVQLNPEPANDVGWTNAPYEAQFLKLYDVTPAASADKAN